MGCEYKDACLMGGSELWGVYMHDRNMEDVNTRMHVYGGAVNYRGCTSMMGCGVFLLKK